MLRLDCISTVFCDALLTNDKGELMFMSVWGRDTTISELLARFTLPDHDDGIRSFTAHGDGCEMRVSVPSAKLLEKQQGRAPNSLFGDLVQLFLFHRTMKQPDKVNREAWVPYRTDASASSPPDVWPLVMETCHVPLLDDWREPVLQAFAEREWISRIEGYGVSAVGVRLNSDDVEPTIEQLVTQGALTLSC